MCIRDRGPERRMNKCTKERWGAKLLYWRWSNKMRYKGGTFNMTSPKNQTMKPQHKTDPNFTTIKSSLWKKNARFIPLLMSSYWIETYLCRRRTGCPLDWTICSTFGVESWTKQEGHNKTIHEKFTMRLVYSWKKKKHIPRQHQFQGVSQ